MPLQIDTNTELIQSPLNYTGGKYKLLPQILPLFPKDIDIFVDIFCGGGNVGINAAADKVIFNDKNKYLIGILEKFFQPEEKLFRHIDEIIQEYGLSESAKYGFAYYNTTGTKGLAKYNRNKYLRLREDFNNADVKDEKYYLMLYVLIVYAFNNQIRFNRKEQFNLPPGKRDFNNTIKMKLKRFINRLAWGNYEFSALDFREFSLSKLTENSLVYVDPPYLISCAQYNEKGGWNAGDELDLLNFLDDLTNKNIRFALSNVIRCKGKENSILIDWLKQHDSKYRIEKLNFDYNHSNYKINNKNLITEEVLIMNY